MSTPIFSNYDICGDCLHSVSCHTEYNSINKFMYCGVCFKLCDKEQFIIKHNPTPASVIMGISAKKQ